MIKKIASKENLIIKRIKQLESKKYRERFNQFMLEGQNLIEEAIRNNADLCFVIYSDSFLDSMEKEELINFLLDKGIAIYNVNDKLFDYIAETETPQGIIGVASKPTFSQEEIIGKPGSNIVILDRVQDPGNLGTILRTADAAGFDCAISIKGSSDHFSSKVIRSAAGSIFRVPIFYIENSFLAVSLLKKNKKKIICSSPKCQQYYYDITMDKDIGLVIGNEANGVSDEFFLSSDHLVKIPMFGNIESLNASVAASILMYESVRQRLQNR